MSDGLFTNMLLRVTGLDIEDPRGKRMRRRQAQAHNRQIRKIWPLPGAQTLLGCLSSTGVCWAIATSGRREAAASNLAVLGVNSGEGDGVTRDQAKYAKPDPDLSFEWARRADVNIKHCVVVGDSLRDMPAVRRARAVGIRLLSGGYSPGEVEQSGAARIYEDPATPLKHTDEVGGRV